ncbi:electron transfer flavoprotein subunit alpha/FixB family protein [Desulfococcaceae bacterium HSG8]|nr:electron transfer flavoprotein subunit alpha/FixB family protein [Desulfococcaceae bacterium HSG8]
MAQIFAYIVHKEGKADDTALELVAAAKKIDASATVTAVVFGPDAVCDEAAASYNEVWKVSTDAYPNAEVIRRALVSLLPADAIALIPHSTFGMDLGPGLSVKLDSAFVADVVDFEGVEDGKLKAIRQEYGGMVSTHVSCDISNGAVINVRPGAFQPDESKSAGGQVADKTGDAGDMAETTRRFIEIVEAEAGDVDITKSEVLISVGRGIEDQDNLEIIDELAGAMGGDVSCSRPIVDAKWLEKPRQVGTSGQTVKPKVYMALGISGSFQHMGGIKGNPYIVAVNKNAKAPIFQLADVGVVADILEFVPGLTDKVNELK